MPGSLAFIPDNLGGKSMWLEEKDRGREKQEETEERVFVRLEEEKAGSISLAKHFLMLFFLILLFLKKYLVKQVFYILKNFKNNRRSF